MYNSFNKKRETIIFHFLFIILTTCFIQVSFAQLPPETPWNTPVAPHPSILSNPTYLNTVHDNYYGTDFTKITDPIALGKSGAAIQHQYAKVQAWNADMTKIWIGHSLILNNIDYSVFKDVNISMSDGRWANTDPNIRYFGEGEYLKKINISTDVVTSLQQFSGYGTCTIGPWEGNISIDDKYVVVTNQAENNATLYDIENDVILSSKQFNSGFDWASITPWGNYIAVSNHGPGTTELYDLNFNFVKTLSNSQQHADFCIDSDGNQVLVEMCPLGMIRLDNLNTTDLLPATSDTDGICGDTPNNPWMCGHVSGRNFDLDGWALISAGIDQCNNGYNGYYERTEIFLLKLDGSGTTRKFGFSRTSFSNYLSQTKATVSRDGTQVIFTSDWDVNGNGGNTVDYLIKYNNGPSYELTSNINSGQGSISPSSGIYSDGSSIELSATPDLGYIFDGWGGDLSGSNSPETLIMDADKYVTADFIVAPTYDLTSSILLGSGSISPSSGTFNQGQSVELTAIPDIGFTFDSWGGDLSGNTNPSTITMDAAKHVTASFNESEPLIAYWTMDENSGNLAYDSQSNNYDASLNNPSASSYSTGKLNGALHIDNINQDGIISSPLFPTPSSYTIASYVKIDPSLNDWGWIAAHGDNIGLFIDDNGHLSTYFYDGVTWHGISSLGVDLRDNQWHHVTGTYDEGTTILKVYIDGNLSNQTTTYNTISYDIGTDFTIGSMREDGETRYFKGDIDELRVYDKALNSTEIQALLVTTLEIDLSLFSGQANASDILLNWTTLSEINNNGFVIKHSTNKNEWIELGFKKGYGTSNKVNNYTYLHRDIKSELNYYQLKQLDKNDVATYSDIISVVFNRKRNISLYPNPTNGKIKLIGPIADMISYEVCDYIGKVHLKSEQVKSDINISSLNNGLYQLKLTFSNGESWLTKIIKQ